MTASEYKVPPPERWRAVPGYEGYYEVSDQGRVRSLDRTVAHPLGSRRVKGARWDTATGNSLDTVRHGHHPEASKTHCPRGHAYDDDNTAMSARGNGRPFRICRTCAGDQLRERRARKRVSR